MLRVQSPTCPSWRSQVSWTHCLLPSPTRSSRWWCARCCSSRDRGSCSAWQEHSPPPQTPPWSHSHPTCCPQPQPHPCRAAREAASLACRTMHFTSPGWVTLQGFSLQLHMLLSRIVSSCGIVFSRLQERRVETRMGDVCFTQEQLTWRYLASQPTWRTAVNLHDFWTSFLLSSLSSPLFYECNTGWT